MNGVLKFAVVREDPDIESALVREAAVGHVLLVASGGCTALTLARRFPELRIAAFDINPLQIAHVRAKQAAAARGERGLLNVGDARPDGLNQCGDFESLFRLLRRFVYELVCSRKEVYAFFDAQTEPARRTALLDRWFASPYWSVALGSFFHEELLVTMFGPAAVQHAPSGSYPAYFQRVLEGGLRRPDAAVNPFLQHIFLGYYQPAQAPEYVGTEPHSPLELIAGPLEAVPELGRFELVSLSNLCDWADDDDVRRWADLLACGLKPGAILLIRTLNNVRELRRHFQPAFRFDDAAGARFLSGDRSLFYNRIEVARRVAQS